METRSEGETADWTYGFGKFEVPFIERFPAVNFQCLCELLLKPIHGLAKVVHFSGPAGRDSSPDRLPVLSIQRKMTDRRKLKCIHVYISTCLCTRFIVMLTDRR